MDLKSQLEKRADGECELCSTSAKLDIYPVPPDAQENIDDNLYLCSDCKDQVEKKAELNSAHWSFLERTIWSENPKVQVVSWRMLNRFRDESWASDILDIAYLDEELLDFAKKTGDHTAESGVDLHKDVYGNVLQNGDTVVLTKSLNVKGTSMRAPVGTVVKNVKLVPDHTDQVEGKVEGQQIVILTQYLKKQG